MVAVRVPPRWAAPVMPGLPSAGLLAPGVSFFTVKSPAAKAGVLRFGLESSCRKSEVGTT